MKVVGCIGAGSFGKVFKVRIGDDLFAVKRVTHAGFRSRWNSIVRMIVGTCRRFKNKPGFSRIACTIPILSDITLRIDRGITIALRWSMWREDPSAISAFRSVKP